MPGVAMSAMIERPPDQDVGELALGHLLGGVPDVHVADFVAEQSGELGFVVEDEQDAPGAGDTAARERRRR